MSQRKHSRKPRKSGPSGNSNRTSHRPRAGIAKGEETSARSGGPSGNVWLYGRHAALAAIANPNRQLERVISTPQMADDVRQTALHRVSTPALEIMERRDFDRVLPDESVHQGVAVLAAPLPDMHLEDICRNLGDRESALVMILDQASDPRNVGAVLRSAAAFGADAVIHQERHAPEATATLAKAASGALETVPLVAATNLSRALKQLKDAGFWCLGLDGQGTTNIRDADLSGKIALVLGAEGAGLRRLVRENCDLLVKIPINGAMESLNLSNAAAITLYEAAQRRGVERN